MMLAVYGDYGCNSPTTQNWAIGSDLWHIGLAESGQSLRWKMRMDGIGMHGRVFTTVIVGDTDPTPFWLPRVEDATALACKGAPQSQSAAPAGHGNNSAAGPWQPQSPTTAAPARQFFMLERCAASEAPQLWAAPAPSPTASGRTTGSTIKGSTAGSTIKASTAASIMLERCAVSGVP